MVPCVWLAAASGIGAAACRLRGRLAWAGLAVLASLLIPDAARTAKTTLLVEPKAEFRGAFAYVHRQWSAGDTLWAAFPEVYEVSFRKD